MGKLKSVLAVYTLVYFNAIIINGISLIDPSIDCGESAASIFAQQLLSDVFSSCPYVDNLSSISLPHYLWRLLVTFSLPVQGKVAIKQKHLQFSNINFWISFFLSA